MYVQKVYLQLQKDEGEEGCGHCAEGRPKAGGGGDACGAVDGLVGAEIEDSACASDGDGNCLGAGGGEYVLDGSCDAIDDGGIDVGYGGARGACCGRGLTDGTLLDCRLGEGSECGAAG